MAPQQGGAPYGPPGVNPRQRYAVMQTSDWAVVLLLMMLPVVGIVMLFVWAFSEGNLNRRNFARAQLIFVGVFFVIALIFGAFSAMRLKSLKNVLDQPPPAPTRAAGF